MDFLTDWIVELLKGWLVDGIMGNLGGLFEGVNTQVGEIAGTVGMAPGAFLPGAFALIRTLSETVILPIAGLVLTFVATYELIGMIIDKSNFHEVDTSMFFRWFFKTAVAVVILSNTFNIVMAIFDVAQSAVNDAAGVISGSTDITADMLATLQTQLEAMGIGALLGLWLQSFFVKIIMVALNICVFIVVNGRLIEIYVLTSVAPLPMATLINREMGQMGQNYMKSLLAVGFQGFLIMVCVAIYAALVQGIAVSGDPFGAIWTAIMYTTLLAFTLFKTGGVSKAIFGAHG